MMGTWLYAAATAKGVCWRLFKQLMVASFCKVSNTFVSESRMKHSSLFDDKGVAS